MPAQVGLFPTDGSEWLTQGTAVRPPKRFGDFESTKSNYVERGRQKTGPTYHYATKYYNTSTGTVYSSSDVTVPSYNYFEYMRGYNHPGYRRYHKRWPGRDFGGDWWKYDVIVLTPPTVIPLSRFYVTGVTPQDYTGAVFANPETGTISSHKSDGVSAHDLSWISGYCPGVVSGADLDSFGATAVARCEPTNPAADLSQAIGELLRDGLPSLPGGGNGNLGEEYLNIQFAWSPTISDGLDFLNALRRQDAIQSRYVKHSGRMLRRRFDFPIVRTSTTSVTSNAPPGFLSGGGAPNGQQIELGTRTVTQETEVRMWFSGAFTYHLPDNAFLRRIAILDKTYGIVPGPDTAWKLTPWSWLLDWFSNAGDVIHNMNAFALSGLVMPYGYMMCDQTTKTTSVLKTKLRDQNGAKQPFEVTDVVIKRSRQRRRANPFGFGVSWDGLSPFQVSILAALGISRRSQTY